MGRTRGYRFVTLLTLFAAASLNAQTGLTVRIVQGDNAINSIRMRRGHEPVVQVLDDAGEPLKNATVSFLLPLTGASGAFGDSGQSLTVQTDERGMATGHGFVPNRVEGPFQIRVTASARGESATASLRQTNADPEVKSSRSKWIAIAAIVGGAAVGGAVFAARGGSSSSGGSTTGATPPPVSAVGGGSITPGSPTFGPPR